MAHSWSIFTSTAASSGLYAKQSIREKHIYSQIVFLLLDCFFQPTLHEFPFYVFPFLYLLIRYLPVDSPQSKPECSNIIWQKKKTVFSCVFLIVGASIKMENIWWIQASSGKPQTHNDTILFAEAKNIAPCTFSHFILSKPQNSNYFHVVDTANKSFWSPLGLLIKRTKLFFV